MAGPEQSTTNEDWRREIARRGQRLEYFTIGWNVVEGLVAVVAGAFAGSISLIGFGVDSFIEVTSGAALLWRMQGDWDAGRRVRREAATLRIVGICFIALAVYIAAEAATDVIGRTPPQRSIVGILVAAISLAVMPLLSRAKRRVALALDSAAMRADATQTDFCAYLSAILLAGLVLNLAFGWWWADPAAALLMSPLILKEGISALRGETCCR